MVLKNGLRPSKYVFPFFSGEILSKENIIEFHKYHLECNMYALEMQSIVRATLKILLRKDVCFNLKYCFQ